MTASDEFERATTFPSSMNDGPHSERQPLLESSKAQDAEEEKTLGSIYSHPNVSLMWVLLAAMFFTAIPISIPAPFFPKFAADECGLSPEEIGWCFSVFPLTSLIMSPIIPYMIGIMGRSNLLASAVALSAVSTVAFGLGTTLPTFLISRMVMGVACSAAMTCCTATLALVFNEHPGEVFGLVEMTFGGAFMIGPPIGGALYVFFGEFWAPFVFTTMPALVIIPLGKRMISLAEDDINANITQNTGTEQQSYTQLWLGLLRLPKFMFIIAEVVVISIAYSCLEPVFAPHLNELFPDMNAGHIGLVFIIQSTFYICGTLVTGRLADRFHRLYLMAFGCFVTVGGFGLLAPFPLLPVTQAHVWPVCMAMVLMGLGTSLALVPSMPLLVDTAVASLGEDDKETTTDIVSSSFNMAFSLGETIGPVLATAISKRTDFQTAMCCVGCLVGVFGAIMVAVGVITNKKTKEKHRLARKHSNIVMQRAPQPTLRSRSFSSIPGTPRSRANGSYSRVQSTDQNV